MAVARTVRAFGLHLRHDGKSRRKVPQDTGSSVAEVIRSDCELIGELFAPDGEGQVIAGDDSALFARTLLPQLVNVDMLAADDIRVNFLS